MANFKYDASQLLYAHSENDRFIHRLNIQDEERLALLTIRNKARSAIRNAFKEAKTLLEEEFNKQSKLNGLDHSAFHEVSPAFWSQGSFTYGTLNSPAITPPQQLDIDDGVYLPMQLFKDQPVYSKQIFFKIVDESLKKLVSENPGWGFDDTKPTCVRINVSTRVHLDFPLYAVPLNRFIEIKEQEATESFKSFVAADSASTTKRIKLDPKEVYLARRDADHWVKSDPKKIKSWFKNEKEIHGRQLVRTCRYLKAWRDYSWDKGGPSSITLMACVCLTFDETSGFENDCEALFNVAEKLPNLLSTNIQNPASPEETLYPRGINQLEIDAIVNKATIFRDTLRGALFHAGSKQEVVNNFISLFGNRIPNNYNYVASLSSVSKVLDTPARKQPAPVVKNMKSG
jgi:hypothetical protein